MTLGRIIICVCQAFSRAPGLMHPSVLLALLAAVMDELQGSLAFVSCAVKNHDLQTPVRLKDPAGHCFVSVVCLRSRLALLCCSFIRMMRKKERKSNVAPPSIPAGFNIFGKKWKKVVSVRLKCTCRNVATKLERGRENN